MITNLLKDKGIQGQYSELNKLLSFKNKFIFIKYIKIYLKDLFWNRKNAEYTEINNKKIMIRKISLCIM